MFKNLYVLTVDDDESFNSLLKKRLEMHDFTVRTTENAIDFIVELKKKRPDFCIVDLNLDKMLGAGFQLIQAIRNKYDNFLPIFVMSRRRDGADIIHALEIGANDYIHKPLDADILFQKLSQHLNLKIDQVKEFPLLEIAEWAQDCTISIDFKIREVNEFGIILECTQFISKGTPVRLCGDIITEIFKIDSVLLDVTNVELNNITEKFCTHLEFDPNDPDLLGNVRSWIEKNL